MKERKHGSQALLYLLSKVSFDGKKWGKRVYAPWKMKIPTKELGKSSETVPTHTLSILRKIDGFEVLINIFPIFSSLCGEYLKQVPQPKLVWNSNWYLHLIHMCTQRTYSELYIPLFLLNSTKCKYSLSTNVELIWQWPSLFFLFFIFPHLRYIALFSLINHRCVDFHSGVHECFSPVVI